MSCENCVKLQRQIKDLQNGGQRRARRHAKYKDLVREWKKSYQAKIDELNLRCHDLAKRIYEVRKGKRE